MVWLKEGRRSRGLAERGEEGRKKGGRSGGSRTRGGRGGGVQIREEGWQIEEMRSLYLSSRHKRKQLCNSNFQIFVFVLS